LKCKIFPAKFGRRNNLKGENLVSCKSDKLAYIPERVDFLDRKMFLLLTGALLFALVCPVWATGEEDFWTAWHQGDYTKAGDLAKDLGAAIPEYYSLAAICYQNTYQYDLFRIYKNKFQKLANPDRLRELLTAEQNANPDDPQIMLLQGIVAALYPEARMGNLSDLLEKAAIKLKDDPYLDNYLALNEINSRNYSLTVQKHLQKAITLKPDYPDPYLNLAMIYAQNKEADKAVAVLLNCFNNCPLLPDKIYASLMESISVPVTITIKPYGQQMPVVVPGMKELYRQKIKAVLNKNPMHLLGLAELFIVKGNTAAGRDLLSGIELNNSNLNTYLQLQMAHLEGNFEEVTRIGGALLNAINEVNDLNYGRLYEAGNILFYGKEFMKAIAFYDAALKMLNPDDDEYLIKINTNLGICSYLNREYSNALFYLARVLTYNPQDASAFVYLGLTYRDMGDTVKAVKYLTAALEYIYDAGWRQEITGIIEELSPAENGNSEPEIAE
jgi:Flp pilus assembly protein TadD